MNQFDTFFYHLINQQLTAGWLDFLMVKFSDKIFWIPFYCVVAFIFFKHFGKKAFLILLFIGVAVVAADRLTSGILKPIIKRERPCHVAALTPRVLDPCNDTGSMPSSHAANHFAIASFIILLYGWKKKESVILWFLWASAVAYSRVYCGVHYPTDVIAGSALGIVIGWVCYQLYQLIATKIKWA